MRAPLTCIISQPQPRPALYRLVPGIYPLPSISLSSAGLTGSDPSRPATPVVHQYDATCVLVAGNLLDSRAAASLPVHQASPLTNMTGCRTPPCPSRRLPQASPEPVAPDLQAVLNPRSTKYEEETRRVARAARWARGPCVPGSMMTTGPASRYPPGTQSNNLRVRRLCGLIS